MTKSKLMMAGAALFMAMALPVASGAQSSGTPSSGSQSSDASKAPVQYGADGGEYTPGGFSLRGRAELTQGGNRLRADAIIGHTTGGTQLTSVEASGNVYFVTPTQNMRGDRAVYNLATAEVVVTGNVVLTQGKNVLSGNRLVYNVRTESARMEGGGGRVQGVFYPQGN